MAAARQPNPLDVLFGTGINIDTHPGNLRYRLICGPFQPIYKKVRNRRTKRATVKATILAVLDDQEDGRSRHRWLPNGVYETRFATYEQALVESPIRFLVKQESATGGTPTWIEAEYKAIFNKVQHILRGKPKRRQRQHHAASAAAGSANDPPPAAVARRQEPSSPTDTHESSILEADLLATPMSVAARAPQHDVVYDPFLSLPSAAQPIETSDRRSLVMEEDDQDEALSSAFFLAHPKDDDVHSV